VPAFGDPIASFTGRFLDSVFVNDWQQTFRTGRAYNAIYVPGRNRIVMQIGSAVFSYDAATFFSRLASREALISPTAMTSVGSCSCAGIRSTSGGAWAYEHFLQSDRFFYPENTPAGWLTNIGDGQLKLSAYDADDRGYLYIASPAYYWGIVSDDGASSGSLMQSMFQDTSFGPERVYVAKGQSGHYFAILSKNGDATMQVWDVTNVANPIKQARSLNYNLHRAAHNADHLVGANDDGDLFVWSGDAIGAGNGPSQQIAKPKTYVTYLDVTTDGTNFYALSQGFNTSISPGRYETYITVLTPSGSSYSATSYEFDGYDGNSIRYGSGNYLGVSAAFTAHLFKLANGVPSEVSFAGNFMSTYYNGPPASSSYAYPAGALNAAVLPLQVGGHQYMIVASQKLGDVYEIKNDDSVTAVLQGHSGTNNPTAPSRATTDIFYGDKVSFIATTPSAAAKNVSWNFGNAESTSNTATTTTGVTITHQYSGLNTTQVPATRTVSATDTATNIQGAITVNIKMPVARFGVTGNSALVSTATATPAILAGDFFYDASDGDVEGHFAQWNIDTATTKTKPYTGDGTDRVSVGACGAHTLNFTTHYGPYDGTLSTVGPDFTVGIGGAFNYTVAPFTATLAAPQNDTINNAVIFSATTRVTSDTSIISAAQASALTWRWDLVDSNDTPVTGGNGPSGTGSSVQNWSIPLGTFIAPNLRARLTISSPTAPGGSCANNGTVKVYSAQLNPPDPQISGDCTQGGPPCNFTMTSIRGIDVNAEGWTVAWSVTPTSVSPTTGTGITFTPAFTANGTYTVSASATNSLGTRSTSKLVTVTKSEP